MEFRSQGERVEFHPPGLNSYFLQNGEDILVTSVFTLFRLTFYEMENLSYKLGTLGRQYVCYRRIGNIF